MPQKVRDKLGLGKDEYVTFLGDLKTFQLWKRDEYQARFAEEADELGEDFDPDAAMDELLFANASPKEVE